MRTRTLDGVGRGANWPRGPVCFSSWSLAMGLPELSRAVGETGQHAVEVFDIDVPPQSARYVTDGGVGCQVVVSVSSSL